MISLLIGSPWHGHCLKTRNEVAIDLHYPTPLHCYTTTPLHRYTATPLHRYTATLLLLQAVWMMMTQRERHSFLIPIHTNRHTFTIWGIWRTLIANKVSFLVCSSLVVLLWHHRRWFPQWLWRFITLFLSYGVGQGAGQRGQGEGVHTTVISNKW